MHDENCIMNKLGKSHELLELLYDESNRGLIFDVMNVQEDLKVSFQDCNGKKEGLVNIKDVCADLHKLYLHKDELKKAKYVLQFVFLGFDGLRFSIVFLGFDGFRFPIDYFQSADDNAAEL